MEALVAVGPARRKDFFTSFSKSKTLKIRRGGTTFTPFEEEIFVSEWLVALRPFASPQKRFKSTHWQFFFLPFPHTRLLYKFGSLYYLCFLSITRCLSPLFAGTAFGPDWGCIGLDFINFPFKRVSQCWFGAKVGLWTTKMLAYKNENADKH